jgi:hypothetical protein
VDLKRRARDYLAHLPPAISGCRGHDTTFMAACWLVRFGLGDRDAMVLLREFNQRCLPPWTEKELAHKLADARKIVGPTLPHPLGTAPAVRETWSLEPYHRWLAHLPNPKPTPASPLSEAPHINPMASAQESRSAFNLNHQPDLL